MTTFRAVVKYEREASDAEKVDALIQGLSECAAELVSLGVDIAEVERHLDDAYGAAEEEFEAMRSRGTEDEPHAS